MIRRTTDAGLDFLNPRGAADGHTLSLAHVFYMGVHKPFAGNHYIFSDRHLQVDVVDGVLVDHAFLQHTQFKFLPI